MGIPALEIFFVDRCQNPAHTIMLSHFSGSRKFGNDVLSENNLMIASNLLWYLLGFILGASGCEETHSFKYSSEKACLRQDLNASRWCTSESVSYLNLSRISFKAAVQISVQLSFVQDLGRLSCSHWSHSVCITLQDCGFRAESGTWNWAIKI